ncbi:Kinesin-associated protein 3, partial [Irineochytrium annulatum]
DDVTLEVVILLGTMANDENVAPMVARTKIIPLLMELMLVKEEDDEIILQIIYVIYQFLLHETTRTILISQTQVVSYLIDLLYDRNVQIRRMCDVSLDIIAEIDEEWVKKIKQQKFQWHNAEYLSVLAQSSDSNLQDDDDDSDGERGADLLAQNDDYLNDGWTDQLGDDDVDDDDE